MKSLILSFSFLCFCIILPSSDFWGNEISTEGQLTGIGAFQAMEIANKWKWSNDEIGSSVNPQEVIFTFPNGRIKNIPLPKDQMIVAVAPYINSTHK
ncbi:hypothetical protein ACFL2E_10660 [Thermodesulfobacteriota bacterium]